MRGWFENSGATGISHVRMFHRQNQHSSAIVQFESDAQAANAFNLIKENVAWGLEVRHATMRQGLEPQAKQEPQLHEQQQLQQQQEQQQQQQQLYEQQQQEQHQLQQTKQQQQEQQQLHEQQQQQEQQQLYEQQQQELQQAKQEELDQQQHLQQHHGQQQQQQLHEEQQQATCQEDWRQQQLEVEQQELLAQQELEKQREDQTWQDEVQKHNDSWEAIAEATAKAAGAASSSAVDAALSPDPVAIGSNKTADEQEYMRTLTRIMDAKRLKGVLDVLIKQAIKRKTELEGCDIDSEKLREEVRPVRRGGRVGAYLESASVESPEGAS